MNKMIPVRYHRSRDVVTVDSRFGESVSTLRDAYAVGLGVDEKSGMSNPGYKYAILNRQNASSAYKMSAHFDIKPMKAHCATFHAGPGYTISSTASAVTFGNAPEASETHDPVLKDQALSKLKRELNVYTPTMNALVPLVEIRDVRALVKGMASVTLDFVDAFTKVVRASRKQPYQRNSSRSPTLFGPSYLEKVIRSIEQRDIRSANKLTAKTLSELWLSYGFGMKPMIADLQSALEVLSSRLNQPQVIRVYGTAVKTYKETVFGDDTSFHLAVGSSFHVSRTDQVRLVYRYTGGWEINLLSGNTYSLSDQYGLRLRANLIPTFWELIPYSWIIDYFTTVGSFLDDTFSVPAPRPIYLDVSRKCERTADFVGKITPDAGYKLESASCTPGSYKLVEFQRDPVVTLPHRSFRIRTLDEVGKHGVEKLLNLVSVLLSSGSKIGRR